MNKIKKRIYQNPSISVFLVETEEGIASASSTISPIGPNSDEVVEVNDWQDINQGDYDLDL
ncbi:hypothetical protein LZQ00_16660 [Sphingobacterium sp. SRCM116780]|uniref:hypothetical protein n=1 Tax=Sphingobacterium sp. SRCM116780 TaxID=2907623 RepID=UPI001F46532E|nr:hypothetical protein [Sphingobacterium sp. SRCM116780]UIR55880.1 hypothetical protein LZQ00_16660 [Sphingobacterium sp. SRCM116780]